MTKPSLADLNDPADLARRCHVEARRAIHPATKAFLLELAAAFEAAIGKRIDLNSDDSDLQNAVADRLGEVAKRGWKR
jgi:hypothetical protein